ncbi:acyl-CoA thioesterase [Marinobacter piscensis]|uniref:acyl-CoA thioesterase n=1 Tax=Marinobacter piscensis TaxID=1562308 RepID=UPI0011A297E7|nr:thioesterase family protein [Marinobacter piscensis]
MTEIQKTPTWSSPDDQPFRYFMQVRYAECDAQKVVFNARYGDYVDLAATEFLQTVSDDHPAIESEFDYQVVKLTIEWKAPARSRDKLELSVRATHLGNTSFELTIDIHNAETGQYLARGEMIGVAVDPETLSKIPIPEALKEAMEQGARNRLVDHAGLFTAPQANRA